ncbi:hypothetical protein JCM3770_007230 [Rhodotorula araucariae]
MTAMSWDKPVMKRGIEECNWFWLSLKYDNIFSVESSLEAGKGNTHLPVVHLQLHANIDAFEPLPFSVCSRTVKTIMGSQVIHSIRYPGGSETKPWLTNEYFKDLLIAASLPVGNPANQCPADLFSPPFIAIQPEAYNGADALVQNCIAECSNWTIKEIISALLAEGRLRKQFWGEVFYYAMFLMKYRLYVPLGGETPYHKINGGTHPFFRSRRIPICSKHVWVAKINPLTFSPKAFEAISSPPSFKIDGKEEYGYELKGTAYGLPQSSRVFHLHPCNKLDKIGYLAVSKEATLYIARLKSDYVLFLTDINNSLVNGKKQLVEDLMGDITNEFDIECKGFVSSRPFLGCKIECDPTTGQLIVRLTAQIVKALKMHDFEDLKSLIQPDLKYKDHLGDPVHKDKYLAWYSNDPIPVHWKLVTHIYAYLSAVRDINLSLGKDRASGNGLISYVDANHAGVLGSGRSTSRIAIFLDGSLISSSSKRQSTVAISTFVARAQCNRQGVTDLEWYKSILCTLPFGSDTPIHVYLDNKSAVDQLLLPMFPEARKTVDVKVKYVHEQVEPEFIDLKWINGNDNVADILTKALLARVTKAHGLAMGLVDYPASKTASWTYE